MKISWPMVFLCLVVGISIAHFRGWLFGLALLLVIVLSAGWFSEMRSQLVWGLSVIITGMVMYWITAPPTLCSLPEQPGAQVNGEIDTIPYYDGEKTSFILKLDTESPYQHKIRIVCLFATGFNRGDTVCLEGDLKQPRPPGNPGEFDFPAYLANQGIFYNLIVKEPARARIVHQASGPLSWMDSLRNRAEKFTRQTLPPEEASVLLGMLWGGRAGMDDQQYDDFQKTGIVHLFSVGGLHVGFLLIMINWLVSLAGLRTKGKFVAGVTGLLIYGTMVAWPPPVIRAVLMGILGLLAYLSGRKNGLLNALAISGSVILLIDPITLFNLSFQLTMLATGGLVCFFPCLQAILPGRGLIKNIILIPVCAEISILPLVAYHFNLISTGSIVTNIATTYLSGAAVILGFLASFFSWWLPSIASLFIYPAGLFIELILGSVRWMVLVPGAYFWVASPSLIMIGLYYAILASLLLALNHRGFWLFKPAVGLLLVWLIILFLPAGINHRGELEIVFIDVGQGDAILIKSPGGKFILVDGGGSQLRDVGTDILLPYLHYRGIRHLDLVVSTHPDIDHVQGLVKVIEQMPVKILGLSSSLAHDEDYLPLQEAADKKKVPCWLLAAGQSVRIEDGLNINILNPQPEANIIDNNQGSVVLNIAYKRFSALLTGDIPAATLSVLADTVNPPLTVVKIPHHGSKGSLAPEFYQQLHPQYAVISVGAENPFGHPHPTVLAALTEAGAKIWRTDQDGAVTVRSDGLAVTIDGWITPSH